MDYKTIVFAGPSAIGKTYIAEQLISLFPDKFEQAKLYTTRPQRTGEIATDRIFLTTSEFDSMVNNSEFLVHSEFGGNMYGFASDSLYPKNKHLLVNAWPWLIPQFYKIKHVIIVGMQPPTDYLKLLESRMSSRGDSRETITKRLELIARDKDDLEKYFALVKKSGAYFIIEDDETVPEQIIPWITKLLGIN